MLDQAREDVRQRAARLAGQDQVHVQRREDAREIAQGLRKTASVDETLVQGAGQALQIGLFETLDENAERFVEGHPGRKQIGKLLGEKQPLTMRQALRTGRTGSGQPAGGGACPRRRGVSRGRQTAEEPGSRHCTRARTGCRHNRPAGAPAGFNLEGHATPLFNELNGSRAVGGLDLAFDELPLSVPGAVAELRHGKTGKLTRFWLPTTARLFLFPGRVGVPPAWLPACF